MLLMRKNGATSNVFRVTLRNSSTGAGLTGLTSASSGLIISTIADNEATAVAYTVAGSTIEGITTLGTFATPTTNKCRFKEVDATNHKGLYEIQLADARFAVSSAKVLKVCLTGATNLLDKEVTIQLTAVDVDDVVRMGQTALPNVVSGNAGAVITAGTGTAQLSTSSGVASSNVTQWSGTNVASPDTAGYPKVTLKTGTGTGEVNLSSGKAPATIASGDIATDAVSAASLAAAAVTKIQSGLATPTNITGGTITTVTNLTNAPTSGDFTTTMKTSIGTAVAASAVASVTGNVGGNVTGSVGSVAGSVGGSVNSVSTGVTVTTNSDKTGYSLSSGGVQAIWEYASRTLTSFGSLVADTATAVWSAVTRTLTSGGGGGSGEVLVVPQPVPTGEHYITAGEAFVAGSPLSESIHQFQTYKWDGSAFVLYTYPDMEVTLVVNGVPSDAVFTAPEIEEGRFAIVGEMPDDLVASNRVAIRFHSDEADTTAQGNADTDVWYGIVPSAPIIAGPGSVFVSPISNRSGRLTIAAGDDYTDESGVPLTFVFDDSTMPSLSGATFTITLRPEGYPDATPITGTGSLVSQVGDVATVKCELTSAQTANGREYASEKWWYDVQATLPGGTVRTLKGPQAPCTVLLDQSQ